MSEDWLSLAEVASRPGLSDRIVARGPNTTVGRDSFLSAVRAWTQCFADCKARRIGLYFEDRVIFVAALYGAWHAGKTVYLPGDTQTATVQQLLNVVDACAGQLPGAIQPLSDARQHDIPLEPLDLHTTFVNVFTSGSTGTPQVIPKRLEQLDAEVNALERTFGPSMSMPPTPVTVFTTVSHQHIYGFLLGALWPLCAGRPFWVERLAYPEEIAANSSECPCVLVSSPAHLKRLPQSLDWEKACSNLHRVFSSGGPLPDEAAQLCSRLLRHWPTEIYGSSETGGVAWRQRGAPWQPLPGVEWKLVNGLLTVSSPHLWDSNWWTTADMAKGLDQSECNRFVLFGRTDRICKIEEKRVSLSAIEARLFACEEIHEARTLVIGGENSKRLGVVATLSALGLEVLHQHGKRALNERLRSALLEIVERVALPRSWRYVKSLPQDAQGKSTEALLTQLFRPRHPHATWLQSDHEHAKVELDISPELLVFDGHFPTSPVLPGVAQLDWAVHFTRQRFAVPPRFLRVEVLKFKRPVLPGTRLLLDLRWDEATCALSFAYSSGMEVHATGRLMFGEAIP